VRDARKHSEGEGDFVDHWRGNEEGHGDAELGVGCEQADEQGH